VIERDWHGLYKEGWGTSIVPGAFAHPAKFRPALIRRIYAHLLEQGYLQAGQTVLDPFGGVALGALHAMKNGLTWVGVELEERFVDLGQQNIDLWNARYSTMPGWGQAAIFQGDSRHLCEVLAGAGFGAALSSPPYSSNTVHGRSGPLDVRLFVRKPGPNGQIFTCDDYGDTPGQLGSMPAGDAPQVPSAVVSSMPFGGADQHTAGEPPSAVVSSMPFTNSLASDDPDKRGGLFRDPKRRGDRNMTGEYGATKGQLGAMAEGQPVQVQGSVSSPPYADQSIAAGSHGKFGNHHEHGSLLDQMGYGEGYSHSEDNLGNSQGTTFWSASAEIMRQVYQVLAPGAVAVWVCKAFVRKGALVDFPGQWQALGESCGFETAQIIRAWVVEDQGAQHTLDGGLDVRKIERKSFFRALQEFKARAAESWKPLSRDDKARYLRQAHRELWAHYEARILEDTADGEPPRPTHARIVAAAQASAYRDAGEPDIETDTQIDYEVVLIQRKM